MRILQGPQVHGAAGCEAGGDWLASVPSDGPAVQAAHEGTFTRVIFVGFGAQSTARFSFQEADQKMQVYRQWSSCAGHSRATALWQLVILAL